MEKKVTIWYADSGIENGDFARLLGDSFNYNFKTIEMELKSMRSHHPHDKLEELFDSVCTLEYDFINQLNLFDVITSKCFIYNGIEPLVKELISMTSNIHFHLVMKEYITKDEIYVGLMPMDIDQSGDLHMRYVRKTLGIK